jgi:hypothetical protein
MRWALAAGWLLAVFPQEDWVKKTVPEAEKVKKLAKKIPPAGREKIEKALGEKLPDAELAPPLFECYTTVPQVSSSERTRCLLTVVTVKGPKGLLKIGVAVATLEKTVHAVKILDNADEKGVESKLFLSQFSGFEYTAEGLYGSPASLADALRKGQEPKDDAGKEVEAILMVNSTMRSIGPAWDRMMLKIEKKDKSAAEEVAAMDRSLDESLKGLPNAKFFKATKQDKYKALAVATKPDLAELKALLEASKFDDAFRRAGKLESDRCAKCHGAYRREFREARVERGLGNGFFSTKLEVAIPEKPLEPSYQAVATGIRKAVLLASEAK